MVSSSVCLLQMLKSDAIDAEAKFRILLAVGSMVSPWRLLGYQCMHQSVFVAGTISGNSGTHHVLLSCVLASGDALPMSAYTQDKVLPSTSCQVVGVA